MVTISPRALAALELSQENKFRKQLVGLLSESFPELVDDAGVVYDFADIAIEDARHTGLRSAAGISVYVIVAFLLGLDVKNDPRLVHALTLSARNEDEKILWLQGWIAAISSALEQ
jgi:hypothetical protein